MASPARALLRGRSGAHARGGGWCLLITSARHAVVTAVRNLRGHQGRQAGICVLEGPHLVQEAIRAGLAIYAVLHTEAFTLSPTGMPCLRAVTAVCAATAPPTFPLAAGVTCVGAPTFAAMSELPAPQGVLAVVARPPTHGWCAAEQSRAGPTLGLALDGVQDPGNVGNLARALGAFGGAGAPLLIGMGTADPFGGKALRASAGAVLHLAVQDVPDLPSALGASRAWGWQWWGLDAHRGEALSGDLGDGPCGFVVGSEGAGLSAGIAALCPMRTLRTLPVVESLGAAQAGTIALYSAYAAYLARLGGPAAAPLRC